MSNGRGIEPSRLPGCAFTHPGVPAHHQNLVSYFKMQADVCQSAKPLRRLSYVAIGEGR